MKIKDGKDKYVTKLIEILSSSCKEKDRNQKIVAKIFIGLIDSLENVEDTTEYEDSLRDLVKDLISNDFYSIFKNFIIEVWMISNFIDCVQ